MVRELRQCTKDNMIPDQVLIDILCTYEFGRKEDLDKIPNHLICKRNGDFWTTWDRIFKIRDSMKSGG